jgi:CBS domain-containing protein
MKGHARQLMTDKVVSISPETTLAEIGRILLGEGFGGVPVVEEDLRVIGFVSQDDLLAALLRDAPDVSVARDVMNHPPIVVDEFTATDDVLALLREAGIHHLPVVRSGRLVGIITPHDVLRYYVEKIIPPPREHA